MKEPVDHILRPQLPWRNAPAITECGYDASKVSTLSREQYFNRRQELGQQRCAMMTCMTCAQTAERHPTWDEDPRLALQREIQWEAPGWRYNQDRNGTRLRDELFAIASIVAEHRVAFDALVAESERRREWLAKKADRAAKQARQTPSRSL